jgi:tetratricopeptide (TPR) repeat protein
MAAQLRNPRRPPDIVIAAEYLKAGKFAQAEPLVKVILEEYPLDVSAMRLLTNIYIKTKRYSDAKDLLQRTLEVIPQDSLARNNYAVILLRQQAFSEALKHVSLLLENTPENPRYLLLKGSILLRMGEATAALKIFEDVVQANPNQSVAQLSYGHALKTIGNFEESVAAYRRAIELSPANGEAYWHLANLKTYQFTDDDIASMKAAITSAASEKDDQSHLPFALAKALEDRKKFDESFKYYLYGNSIRSTRHPYDPKKNRYNTVRQLHTCTKEFFSTRAGQGCTASDPIFIVGLPRSGSTLLEQILASHSSVEGTAELPDLIAISRKLGEYKPDKPATAYPETLSELSPERLRQLGEGYLQSTRIQRSSRPFFIDKMPNNFLHIGLIHLILPNAKIIDARRNPMAGCFSCYKQLFAQGQRFSYKLSDLGHYYRNYIELMNHWDEVLPGRVLRVQYEDMVAGPERQIRRLLSHCELPFEQQCLRFYETNRAIRTPSSEQVRQPIYTQGLEQWRHFDAHLGPLKDALGPLIKLYPT